MKTFQLIRSLLLVVAIACIAPGCEKTGAMGPEGVQGEDGPQGERGDRGVAGSKGAKGDRGNTGATGAKGPKGDRGDTGAGGATGGRGAKGERGDAGPQGPAGAKGAQGAAGVGNVIYSGWIDPASLSETPDGKLEINAPKLTSEVLDHGEVYLYLRVANNPSHVFHVDTDFTIDGINIPLVYSLGVGKIWIENRGPSLSDETDPIIYFEYRYVLIPGGTAGVSGINPNDYQSVSRAFQLEH